MTYKSNQIKTALKYILFFATEEKHRRNNNCAPKMNEEDFKNAAKTVNFGFGFEENSVRKIAWLS